MYLNLRLLSLFADSLVSLSLVKEGECKAVDLVKAIILIAMIIAMIQPISLGS